MRGAGIDLDVHLADAGRDNDGAIGVVANLVDLAGLRFEDIDVLDSPRDGIKFTSMKGHTLSDTTFDRVRIVNPGIAGAGCGIVAANGAVGSATISNVTVVNPKTNGYQGDASAFKLIEGAGNSGLTKKETPSADVAAARRDPAGQ